LTALLMFSASAVVCQELAENSAAACQNYLFISGESNVNQFTFSYSGKSGKTDKTRQGDENIIISIPIKDFEASNPMMYKDFLELMKESEYPRIKVSFPKDALDSILKTNEKSCPFVEITIAGITRTYNIDCSIARCADNFYLRGNQVVKLSDFRLKPPTRLMGLVKVNNEINVDFGFIITFTENNSISAKL
jgi:hypothetical protein